MTASLPVPDPNSLEKRLNRARHALFNGLRQLQPAFVADEFNKPAMHACAYWLIGEAYGETSPGQGLLLAGPVGTGKTDLLTAMSRAIYRAGGQGFEVVNVKQVEKEFNRSDDGSRDRSRTGGDHVILRYASVPHIAFDDLGFEDDGKHYGRSANIMAEIIAMRYEQWRKGARLTHFTTNCTPEQLQQRYDQRTVSRLMEMCGHVYLGGPDRRLTAAPPKVAEALMPRLFDQQQEPDEVSAERAAKYFEEIRKTVAESMAPALERGRVLRLEPLTKEQETAELIATIGSRPTDQLTALRDGMDNSEWNRPLLDAIDQELEAREESDATQAEEAQVINDDIAAS
jgi:energy-coupling factor transporter ATP-binding protein EcfA2